MKIFSTILAITLLSACSPSVKKWDSLTYTQYVAKPSALKSLSRPMKEW